MEGQGSKVHLLHGRNSDSGLYPKQVDFFSSPSQTVLPGLAPASLDTSATLFHALSTARVVKSKAEIEVMRYCAWVASQAHVQVMRTAQAGMIEYELEATFLYEIYRNG
jgi:Xaa-Pro aminopeptidase